MANTTDIEQLFNTMMQLTKLMSQRTQETREEKAATMLQFSALQFLNEQQKVIVTDLASFLKLSKSSTTQLIERLEKAGFVERINDKEDRRIVRLMITKKGKKEYLQLKDKLVEKMRKVFFRIPKKDIHELIRIHNNLIESLKNDHYE